MPRILRLVNSGIPRLDFLHQASRLLLELSQSAAVQIWVEENGSCARTVLRRSSPDDFEFELVPCPRHGAAGAARHGDSLPCGITGRGVDIRRARLDESGDLGFDDGTSVPGELVASMGPQGSCCSATLAPLIVGEDVIGWLLLAGDGGDGSPGLTMTDLERVARTFAIALVNQRAQAALRERVKELTGLYQISHLAERPGISLDQLLQSIAALLPPAWQYPEITVGRIVLDGRSYWSGEECEGLARQTAQIVVGGQRRGVVEVIYREGRPRLDEGPFLKEERKLLNAIARDVAAIIERRQAAQERTRLREQLLHADRLATIGQLAAGVAHELNEPLGAVLGFAQLAKKASELSPEVENDLAKIEAAALHAREIVKKLMLFARQTPPREMKVNLNQVVHEGLYFLEARCARNRIELERRLDLDLPEITADPSQLQQVLVNLVVNAVQAMPDGGRLTISTEVRGGAVVLSVEDDGLGMSEEVRRQAFLPFFTTKDVNEGTGLGLAVVHGIVTSHGGTIHVESEEGAGSRFAIELPVSGPVGDR